ncbi:energy transducer TonB [Paraflavitalea soli]|uniref:Energy transducer TonB n=1 Tax=Paraflavitalea soli TaxID=2315862 RepID=A0A3B7MQG5_9BACT|nr:energy transducer TonB [Paraflavitalea soli]AXY76037.1 energy transducer TonB [Paraflavitalea soli]
MKPDMILQSDMLDILFEGRNKDYGAYNLRKDYNRRLMKAMCGTLLLVLLFIGGYYWAGKMGKEAVFIPPPVETAVVLNVVEPNKPEELKPPQEQPKKVATIKSVVPVIVPDHVQADPPPSIDELEKETAAIGTKTQEGETPTGPVSPPPATEPSGTGTAPAPVPVEEDRILPVAEKMPEFPGGQDALRRFLGRHLRVPEEALEPGQRVKVPVRFVVSKDGQLSGVEFMGTADEAFKKEIMRVVAKMPRWIPGSQGGKTVAVYCMIPIIFEVSE